MQDRRNLYFDSTNTGTHRDVWSSIRSIHPMAFAMRWSDKMDWEKLDHVDVTCPDGFVIYRLSREKK